MLERSRNDTTYIIIRQGARCRTTRRIALVRSAPGGEPPPVVTVMGDECNHLPRFCRRWNPTTLNCPAPSSIALSSADSQVGGHITCARLFVGRPFVRGGASN